jgi:hypothetical protein
MLVENRLGISGDELRKLQAIGKRYSGIGKLLAEEQENLKKLPDAEARKEAADVWNKTYAKEFGYMIDSTGEIFKATFDPGMEAPRASGEAVSGTVNSLILGMGEDIQAELGETLSQDLATAMEIADNTRDMAHILEVGTNALLETISGTLGRLFGWLSGDSKQRIAREKAQDQYQISLKEQSTSLQDAKAAQRQLNKDLKDGSKYQGEERKLKEAELVAMTENIKKLEKQIFLTRDEMSRVSLAEGKTPEAVMAAAKKASQIERGLSGELSEEKQKEIQMRASEPVEARIDDISGKLGVPSELGQLGFSVLKAFAPSDKRTEDQKLKDLKDSEEFWTAQLSAEEIAAQDAALDKQTTAEEVLSNKLHKEKKEDDKKNAEDIKKAIQEMQLADLREMMFKSGEFEEKNVRYIAEAFARGKSVKMTDSQKTFFENPEVKKFKGGMLNDFMVRGDRVIPFSSQDDVIGAKAGGPLAGAVGSGKVVNVTVHNYNDGPGMMRTFNRAVEAGLV